MAEYVSGESMAVDVGDPITFENKTDERFSVGVGIVFRKSGLYRVSVVGKHTSVEIEPEIIRCRNCANYSQGKTCYMVGWYNTADDFCSQAERREEGENEE